MLASLLKTAVGVIGALWLAIAGWAAAQWWEHRPAGQPQIRLLMFSWSAPDSLAAQRDQARTALAACQANLIALDRAVGRQNAAMDTLAAEAGRRLGRASAALARQRAASERAQAMASGLLASPPAGDDSCRRMEDADRRILETLR